MSDPNPSFGAEGLNGAIPEQEAKRRPQIVPPSQTSAPATPRWLQRAMLVIFVFFCIEVGMLLCVLPWTRVWTENSLLVAYPTLRTILHHNFVRGAISGLGFVDIWLGIWEAVQYRESE